MNVFSRIMVTMLGLVVRVLNFPKPFSFVGPDASLSLVREIIGLGVKRVMVITDGPLLQLGLVDPLIELMKDSKVKVFEIYLPLLVLVKYYRLRLAKWKIT